MNYLQLVQKAMHRAGVREAAPSTLVGATGIVEDFKEWVADSWRELQEESPNWFFRQDLDQTLAVSASDDKYAMPNGLETLNYRTITIYTTAKQDETPVEWCDYETWRTNRDTKETSEGRPTEITEDLYGANIYLWPVPDQSYTLRYDGVFLVEELSADTDTPGPAVSFEERYHWVIVWDAVMRYALAHEDGQKYEEASKRFKKLRARMSEKQMPPVYINAGQLRA